MKCPACGADAPEESRFCPRCGVPRTEKAGNVSADGGPFSQPAESVSSSVSSTRQAEQTDSMAAAEVRRLLRPPAARQANGTQEQVLWQGGYSGKDMLETWSLYALISVGLLVLYLWAQNVPVRLGSLIFIILLWLYGTLVLAYRKLSVSYRLTNRRFFHEKGIFWRTIDRIELIDIKDVSLKQSLFDRLVGVGTIVIKSSDVTHPELSLPGIKNVHQVADLIDNARLQERRSRAVHMETI